MSLRGFTKIIEADGPRKSTESMLSARLENDYDDDDDSNITE